MDQRWRENCIGWLVAAWLVGWMVVLTACRPSPPTPTEMPTPTWTWTVTATPDIPTATPTPAVYVVQPGDTLSVIATRLGVPMIELQKANNIQDPNLIAVGQKLVIPGPTSVPTATVPPTATPTPDIPPQLDIVDVLGRGAPDSEIVIIRNRGRSVSLKNWTLRDGRGNVFVFPDLYLSSGAEVRIHTGVGENTPLHLYWKRNQPVWENAGSTAILADERGVIYASKPLN